MILPFDEQARLFPNGHRNRAKDPRHPFYAQPVLRLRQQGVRRLLVLRVEVTEKASAWAKALLGWHFQREFIDMRRYTAHRLAIAVSDEELRSCMAEKRILSRVDQLQLFGTDLRNEMLEPFGKGAAEIDKLLAPLFVADRRNRQCLR